MLATPAKTPAPAKPQRHRAVVKGGEWSERAEGLATAYHATHMRQDWAKSRPDSTAGGISWLMAHQVT